jgi:FKBP-type peptidyl-prolyl cis-trans isomerase SlpA
LTEIITSTAGPAIEPGSRVTLHFSLLYSNGQEIDTTRDGKPASFTVGDGSLLPGFEAVLLGKQAGFAAQLVLAPAQAFGEHNPANVRSMSRARFTTMAGDVPLEKGLVISFQSADGELPGVLVDIYTDTVKVDFNHPLAGAEITFDVAVLKVEDRLLGAT